MLNLLQASKACNPSLTRVSSAEEATSRAAETNGRTPTEPSDPVRSSSSSPVATRVCRQGSRRIGSLPDGRERRTPGNHSGESRGTGSVGRLPNGSSPPPNDAPLAAVVFPRSRAPVLRRENHGLHDGVRGGHARYCRDITSGWLWCQLCCTLEAFSRAGIPLYHMLQDTDLGNDPPVAALSLV